MATTDTSLPLAWIVGAIGLILVLWLLSSLRGNGRRRLPRKARANAVASAQAERDVLRANHAVEVADLERKLADAQARFQKDRDAVARLKEMEGRLDTAKADNIALEAARADAEAKIAALGKEIETLKAGGAALDGLTGERDAARAEATWHAQEIATLRKTLGERDEALARDTAERKEDAAAIERLTGEREDARAALERERALADDLRREAQSVRERLAESTGTSAGAAELQATIAQLRAREAKATQTVEAHAATIAELREALAEARTAGAKASEADFAALRRQLATLETREHTANETLSRLAYEHDGLKGRLATAERLEREARAQADKDETLLELRQQKIYDLEARLREQHQALQAAQRRADTTGTRSAEAAEGEADSRVATLRAALEEANAAKRSLEAELETARTATPPTQSYEEAREIAEALSAAQAEAEELRAEITRLRAAPPASAAAPPASADVAALREAIRVLADRFMDDADPLAESDTREPSLSERIRAFKASREASVRRPLRIAAPKER